MDLSTFENCADNIPTVAAIRQTYEEAKTLLPETFSAIEDVIAFVNHTCPFFQKIWLLSYQLRINKRAKEDDIIMLKHYEKLFDCTVDIMDTINIMLPLEKEYYQIPIDELSQVDSIKRDDNIADMTAHIKRRTQYKYNNIINMANKFRGLILEQMALFKYHLGVLETKKDNKTYFC